MILTALPAALEVNEGIVQVAVRETADALDQMNRKAVAERESAWRAAFKPHAYLRGSQERPSSITMCGITGPERWLKIPLDYSKPPVTFVCPKNANISFFWPDNRFYYQLHHRSCGPFRSRRQPSGGSFESLSPSRSSCISAVEGYRPTPSDGSSASAQGSEVFPTSIDGAPRAGTPCFFGSFDSACGRHETRIEVRRLLGLRIQFRQLVAVRLEPLAKSIEFAVAENRIYMASPTRHPGLLGKDIVGLNLTRKCSREHKNRGNQDDPCKRERWFHECWPSQFSSGRMLQIQQHSRWAKGISIGIAGAKPKPAACTKEMMAEFF